MALSEESPDQALYELALIALDSALGQTDPAALLSGLEDASKAFRQAASAGPDMDEAVALGHAISAVAGYCAGRGPSEVESDIAATRGIAMVRLVEMDRSALRAWLRPSFSAESAWYGLVNTLEGLPTRLEEASWLTRPYWRCVIEIKRELVDASREGIRKYLGQAASYLLTGPKLGFLVVLDLCSQKEWSLTVEDNCWIERVQGAGDSAPRAIVVWRIPGGRPAPSSVKTPVTTV